MRSFDSFSEDDLISATSLSILSLLLEYVRARCTLRAARSRAHAAPILGIVRMGNSKRTIWLLCAHPPDAPVMRARRPARSLWAIVFGRSDYTVVYRGPSFSEKKKRSFSFQSTI